MNYKSYETPPENTRTVLVRTPRGTQEGVYKVV
jgi:hypothetical protein